MDLTLETITSYAAAVSDRMFGGNILIDRDRLGVGTFDEAIAALGLKSVRYPGGTVTELYFDVTNPDATTAQHPDTGATVDLLPFSEFMAHCAANGLTADIVLPTRTALLSGAQGERMVDPEAVTAIRAFVRDILKGHYGDVTVDTFEIGNEYWLGGAMTAEEYGRVSSAFALAIQREVDNFVATAQPGADWTEPSIAVQIGQYGKHDTRPGWQQNELIMAEFSTAEAAAVDAIVGHYYNGGGFDSVTQTNWFFDRMDEWNDNAKFSGLDAIVTEWNTDHAHTQEFGLRQSATMLHMFSEMVALGVDGAWAWPVQQNTTNDLFGNEGQTFLTTGGEMFRLISENLSGAYLRGRDYATDHALYHFTVGKSDVIYVVNRTASAETFTLDLGTTAETGDFGWSLVLGADGIPDHKNTLASLHLETGLDLSSSTLSLDLQPYEIAMVTLAAAGTGVTIAGQNAFGANVSDRAGFADDLTGTMNADTFQGFDGNDRIDGSGGADFIDGGPGNDTLLGGGQADTIHGGSGNDYVEGGYGPDLVYLDDGDDTFLDIAQAGRYGTDTIHGGNGNDTITALDGDDLLFGGAGNDLLDGGTGNDTLSGGTGDDTLRAGDGNDLIHLDGGTNVVFAGGGDDLIRFESGAGEVHGGDGIDTLDFSNADGDFSLHVRDGSAWIPPQNPLPLTFDGIDHIAGTVRADQFVFTGPAPEIHAGDGGDAIRVQSDGAIAHGEGGDDSIDLHGADGLADGGDGNDRITVDGTGSIAAGGTGNDTLHGGDYAEILDGGDGDDLLNGGQGDDILTGGGGADIFLFNLGRDAGRDTITDFEIGTDRLIIHGLSPQSALWDEVAVQDGDDVLIDIFGICSLRIEGHTLSDIEAQQF
ncbi:calcium-binding protein [Pseudoruegeria sp. HB172150]|uniref:calcium-binding protein n=1 Tax=Pseudoruegeria sp. HB172150 TaxID=2721164 RepID=UPI001556D914|nr:calcium-binding protein [Pseudoruegeria sp. HB172150]